MKIIRELLGVVTSNGADNGIVVTGGAFTADAIEFANENPIRLIDGVKLAKLISDVQPEARQVIEKSAPQEPTEAPQCPTCNSEMELRTARRGPNAGKRFWGCSQYPKCKGTRKCSAEMA